MAVRIIHILSKMDKLSLNWTEIAASCLYSSHNINIAYHMITGSEIDATDYKINLKILRNRKQGFD